MQKPNNIYLTYWIDHRNTQGNTAHGSRAQNTDEPATMRLSTWGNKTQVVQWDTDETHNSITGGSTQKDRKLNVKIKQEVNRWPETQTMRTGVWLHGIKSFLDKNTAFCFTCIYKYSCSCYVILFLGMMHKCNWYWLYYFLLNNHWFFTEFKHPFNN